MIGGKGDSECCMLLILNAYFVVSEIGCAATIGVVCIE